MTVTAEGVETEQQAAELRSLSCGFGQGFYFNRPLTCEDARAMLESRAGGATAPGTSGSESP